MDKLSNRYFIRYNNEKQTNVRMPLCSAKTLLRVFIQFLIADFHSLEIYREDYFDKKVFTKERKKGVLVRGQGISLRAKTIGDPHWDGLISKFREGLYDPEKNGTYNGNYNTITQFDEDGFESAIAVLATIQDEGSFN